MSNNSNAENKSQVDAVSQVQKRQQSKARARKTGMENARQLEAKSKLSNQMRSLDTCCGMQTGLLSDEGPSVGASCVHCNLRRAENNTIEVRSVTKRLA